MQQEGFRDELWALCGQYFNRRSNINHYLGISRAALDTVAYNNEITIKKLFYVLRPLLAAKWCVERNCIAPMSICPLMSLMPENLQKMTDSLIICKAKALEGHIVTIDMELKQYIDREYEFCTQASAEMPKTSFDTEPLDIFFRKMIAG